METGLGVTVSLAEIEAGARVYSREYEYLSGLVRTLNEEMEAAKRRMLPAIKRAVEKTAGAESELRELVDAGRELFVKPRTVVFHGVKVGLEKGKGKIEWDDEEQVVKLIKKHFPDQVEVLVKTKETPNKKALTGLSVADLRRIGCTTEDTGDQIIVRCVDNDVEKAVAALMKAAAAEV